MTKFARNLGLIFAASLLLVPVIVYLSGSLRVGPYEGESGLLGMTGQIYADVIGGKPAAWFLLLSPALLFSIWFACLELGARAAARPAE